MSVILGGENFAAVAADVNEYRFLMNDYSNCSASQMAAKHSSGKSVAVFGVSTADAESDEEELIQYERLEVGKIYTVEAGETIAAGELVCPAADGKANDHDATNDVAVGTCLVGGDDGDLIIFVVDSNFGLVHA